MVLKEEKSVILPATSVRKSEWQGLSICLTTTSCNLGPAVPELYPGEVLLESITCAAS